MIVEIEGAQFQLAHPDELPIRHVSQEEVMRLLLVAKLIVDPLDVPMNTRLRGKPVVGKTAMAYAAGKRIGHEIYILQATVDTGPEGPGVGKRRQTVQPSAAAGNFELNVMMPVMAYDLLESIHLLAAVSRNFDRRCIRGLAADATRASSFVEQSLAMATALAPVIGYEKAAELAKEAYETGGTIREVATAKSGLTPRQITELLDPETQAGDR